MFSRLFNSFNDLLFPHNCIFCARHLPHCERIINLCSGCQNAIRENRPPFCPRCSRHLIDPVRSLCSDCVNREPHFDRAWGATVYNDAMKKLIHFFKYGNKTVLRHHFSRLIFSFIESYRIDINQFDIITPIPLHPVRFRERGYNQSQLLAQALSQRFLIPTSAHNLVRIKNTRNQAHLGQKERWTNIEGAFRIKHPCEYFQRSVLIVDDLLTTGATVSEAARVLKEAGAKKVGVLTLAIT